MDARLLSAGLVKTARANPYDRTYGKIEILWYGKAKSVDVIFSRNKPDDQPNERQVEAFAQFISRGKEFFADLELSLFDYFNIARIEADLDDETKNKLFPKIHSPKELQPLIELTGVLVSYYDGDGWLDYMGLLMECTWEVEHGLGVKIVDGKVVKIGFQDIVL